MSVIHYSASELAPIIAALPLSRELVAEALARLSVANARTYSARYDGEAAQAVEASELLAAAPAAASAHDALSKLGGLH